MSVWFGKPIQQTTLSQLILSLFYSENHVYSLLAVNSCKVNNPVMCTDRTTMQMFISAWKVVVVKTSTGTHGHLLSFPVHPDNAPPPAHSLVSLGNDDGDDKRCQHSSRD